MADVQFLRKVTVRPGSRCWIWTGGISGGYGRITRNYDSIGAHRISYEQHIGPIPDGLFVLHRCDRKTCVNPDHLFVGTQAQNVQDCHAKGRASNNLPRLPGSANPASKLTEQQVREIRASSETQSELARRYGVSQALLSKIVRHEAWRHVQ